MKRFQLALAVVLLATWTAAASAQEAVNIVYKPLKPGEVRRMHTGTSTVGTMGGMGPGTQNMTQKFDQWMKMECLNVDADGNTTVRMTFERMAMTMAVGPITMSFDSAEKNASASQSVFNPAAKMFQAMVGKSATARYDPQGKCLELKGMKEVMQEAFDQVPYGKDMAKTMESMFSDNSFAEKFGHQTWLPKGSVKIGDIWSSQQDMPLGPMGKVIMKAKNKLIGIETVNGHRCARVAMTINMEVGNEDKPFEVNGMKMKIHMTSIGGTGSWLWDLDRGQMVQMKQAIPTDMTVESQRSAAQSQPAETFKMSQKLTCSEVMELVEGDPNKMPLTNDAAQPAAKPVLLGVPAAPATQPAGTP